MKGLGGLFGQKIDHPLAVNPRELKQTLDALPKDNAFKALIEIAGWRWSLCPPVSELPVDRLYDAASASLKKPRIPHCAALHANTCTRHA